MRNSVSRFGRRLWRNRLGQDLVEYALAVGFVAVAAGATMPAVAGNLTHIYEKVTIQLARASGTSPNSAGARPVAEN